jgi:hypothetical protein
MYVALNILLAVATLILVLVTNSPVLACILVLLGKWRVLAVRVRYWWLNIRANLVDMIVGLSFASLIFLMGGYLAAQIVATVLYAAWLIFIKPSSKPALVSIQAGVALLLGITVATSFFYGLPPVVLVAACFLIGYAVTRHVLVANLDDGSSPEFVSLVSGLVLSELAWAAYHWLVAYGIPDTGLKLPQFALIAMLMGFVALTVYRGYDRDSGKAKVQDIIMPIIFAVAVILVMLLAFSGASISLS